jgi:hypothetical protein
MNLTRDRTYLLIQPRWLSKAISYSSKSKSKNIRRQTKGWTRDLFTEVWNLCLHLGSLSCPPRVNSKLGLFQPLSPLYYTLASFLVEAKRIFINFLTADHNLGSYRTTPSRLGGFTSKSNKCFISAWRSPKCSKIRISAHNTNLSTQLKNIAPKAWISQREVGESSSGC